MNKTAPEILEEYIRHLASEGLSEEDKNNECLIEDYCSEVRSETRQGEFETDICTDYSRHYESKSVAIHLKDFNGFTGYLGWTYWYGGGKHGYPSEIDWTPYAYFLDLVEEREVTTIVRIFEKKKNE
jgi:hypothetical protein